MQKYASAEERMTDNDRLPFCFFGESIRTSAHVASMLVICKSIRYRYTFGVNSVYTYIWYKRTLMFMYIHSFQGF